MTVVTVFQGNLNVYLIIFLFESKYNCLQHRYQAEDRLDGNKPMKCSPLVEALSSNQPDENLKTINYFMSIAVVAFILAIVLAVLNPKC